MTTTADMPRPRLFTDDGRPATDVCARCGYGLRGLPSRGRCPECGIEYDDDVVVLIYGRGRGGHGGWVARQLTGQGWTLLTQVACVTYVLYAVGGSVGYTYAGIMLASWCMPGLASWVRGPSPHPAPSQVRLSAVGCVQHDDLAPPDPFRTVARLLPWGVLLVALPWYLSFGWRDGLIALGIILFLIASSVAFAIIRAHAARNPRWGSLVDDWNRTVPTAWEDVDAVHNEWFAHCHVLRITTKSELNDRNGEAVHIEYVGADAERAYLRGQIAAWRQRARDAARPGAVEASAGTAD